jgi:hypothetical protein
VLINGCLINNKTTNNEGANKALQLFEKEFPEVTRAFNGLVEALKHTTGLATKTIIKSKKSLSL